MPDTTVQARPDAPPMDYEMAADVLARMLETADDARRDLAEGGWGLLSLFLADAALLAQVTSSGWGRDDLEALAGRLWMVAR